MLGQVFHCIAIVLLQVTKTYQKSLLWRYRLVSKVVKQQLSDIVDLILNSLNLATPTHYYTYLMLSDLIKCTHHDKIKDHFISSHVFSLWQQLDKMLLE